MKEFEQLAESWNKLLEKSPVNQLFLRWEWLYCWAKYYLGSDRLMVLTAFSEEKLIGIAPLYLRPEKLFGLLNVRTICFLGSGEVCSPYPDFIISEKKKTLFMLIFPIFSGREETNGIFFCLRRFQLNPPRLIWSTR